MFERIPDELKQYRQWVVWRYEDKGAPKPTKVPYSPVTGGHASVTDPQTWGTYNEAVEEAFNQSFNMGFNGIGFVLSDNDPYSIIDLDNTEGDDEAFQRQLKVFESFNSYSERSPSGNGLHIIVRGKLPPGRRRRAYIEVYTTERYMTMTGDVFHDVPIAYRQELLNVLVAELGKGAPTIQFDGNSPQRYEDEEIYNRACAAVNGEKFQELWRGEWQNKYPSQSEADQALINILTFYTQNYQQIARLFRMSALGQRPKAQRHSYLFGTEHTPGMVQKAFDKMLPPVDIDHLRNEVERVLEAQRSITHDITQNEQFLAPVQIAATEAPKPDIQTPYSVPPGLVGDIAQFIYAAAPRAVPEIALAGAIGLMAGICGRAYNVYGTGLNQYVLLLARTGSGKEAIANGIDKIMKEVRKSVPASKEFVGPSAIASEQALVKYFATRSPSFVSLAGEFGLLLKQMSGPYAPMHMIGLRRMLLDLFNKSGEGRQLGEGIWSDTQKNTAAVFSPALTIMGESTPEKFYETITDDMIAEGLLPRFLIVEYHGLRVKLNEQAFHVKPDQRLIEHVAALCNQALILNQQNQAVHVQFTSSSKAIYDQFNEYCDAQMNGSRSSINVELWNRAHIKGLKLGALVAVGVNPFSPVITDDIAHWALHLVTTDIENLLKRFNQGETGGQDADESKQLDIVRKIVTSYLKTPYGQLNATTKKSASASMHYERIVPYSMISQKTLSLPAFKNDKLKATGALKKTLDTLLACGDLIELGNREKEKHGMVSARAFMLKNVSLLNDL